MSIRLAFPSLLYTLLFAGAVSVCGCEKKTEKIVDIETPEGGIEIERSSDSGDIKIKVKED